MEPDTPYSDLSGRQEPAVIAQQFTQALEIIESHLHTRAQTPSTLPGNHEQQKVLLNILDTIKTSQQHVLEISEGKLDSPISLKGPLGGALKNLQSNLQSNLRHLTWKTEAIAKGDFSQKVDFLHEFSVAFNSMVSELAEAKKTLLVQSEEIQKTNASLFISNKQYKSLILESPVSICVVQDGKIILTNPAFLHLLHVDNQEKIMNQPFLQFIHQGNKRHFLENMSRYAEYGGSWNTFEEEMKTTDGTSLSIEIIITKIVFESEPSTLFLLHDITERKKNEYMILSSLQEKEILLKEVYHRVKNNMQIIWSLLSMQSNKVQDETIKRYFTECQNRVQSLALVHENLYQTDNLRDINYGQYLSQLSAHLFETYQVNADDVTLVLKSENEIISQKKAVPCSLIVNELVSNSLKYAFKPGEVGTISIEFSYDTKLGAYTLEYRDTGPGIPPEISPDTAQTLGMQLIYGLTRQLSGTVFLENDRGAHYIIRFPQDSGNDESCTSKIKESL